MKCALHSSEEAVGVCDKCGAGICQYCFNASEYISDGGKHLCRSCNLQVMHDMLADEKKNAIKSLIKVIFFGLCVGVGCCALSEGSNGVPAYFLIAGIGCVPTFWRNTTNSLKDDIREGVAEAHGDYSLTFISIIIRIVLSFVFGGIAAPFVLLFGVVKFIKAKLAVARLQKKIEAFQA